MNIRQAAAINLKNLVSKHWREKKNLVEKNFIIAQSDKENLKNNFLDAIIRSADEKKIRFLKKFSIKYIYIALLALSMRKSFIKPSNMITLMKCLISWRKSFRN